MITDTSDSITKGIPIAKYTEGTQRRGLEEIVIFDFYSVTFAQNYEKKCEKIWQIPEFILYLQ
jgi:hypothetical protein